LRRCARPRRRPGFHRSAARIDAQIVVAASLRTDAGLAHLTGSATLPAARRRGLQTALIRRRLEDAARDGCDLAFVVTAPGSKSQENLLRAGFAPLYVRAALERPVAVAQG
jgi:GNAT superfamily N-acetyltransferase